MSELHITNAQIVTRDAVFLGDLLARAGRIVEVQPAGGTSTAPGVIDFEGDYLLPGLVELHTDNLECAATPRPGVHWPAASAVVAHDAQMAVSGITTVFDAVADGDIRRGGDRLDRLDAMVEAVTSAQAKGRFRADHRQLEWFVRRRMDSLCARNRAGRR